jgi:hypothetical protein
MIKSSYLLKMAELLSGIEELRTRMKYINTSGITLDSAALDIFNESGFNGDLNFLDLPQDKFRIEGSEANYQLVTTDGDIVNLDRIHEGITNGNLMVVIDELKFPRESLPPKVFEYISKYKNEWNSMMGTKDIAAVDAITLDGINVEREVGFSIDNASQLQAALEADESLKVKFQKDIAKLREKLSKNSESKVGRWVKRSVILGTAGLTIAEVWKMINEHRQAMNGCWMVHNANGTKCKITTMSKCGGNTPLSCTAVNHVCGDGTEDCFSATKCMVKNNELGTCTEILGNCSNGECSKYCGSIDLPPGYRSHCVNVNFWGAANDFFDDIISPSRWMTWLFYIGIAVVVLAIIIAISR